MRQWLKGTRFLGLCILGVGLGWILQAFADPCTVGDQCNGSAPCLGTYQLPDGTYCKLNGNGSHTTCGFVGGGVCCYSTDGSIVPVTRCSGTNTTTGGSCNYNLWNCYNR